MVCKWKRGNDKSIPISHEELEIEYQRGVKALQIEQDKVRQEESKKPRRKVPKAGCYPSGFSAFTGKRVECTISFSELRKDLLIMTSASEPIRPEYFNDAGSCAKQALEQGFGSSAKRLCRQNRMLQNFVHPHSVAEERRQLQNVLRQSTLEQPALPYVPSNKKKRG